PASRGTCDGLDYALAVREGVGDESTEQDLRRKAELGRLLAAAAGYRVVASDGTQLGWLDHVRYERHADHPDEIVIRRRGLLPRRRSSARWSTARAPSRSSPQFHERG